MSKGSGSTRTSGAGGAQTAPVSSDFNANSLGNFKHQVYGSGGVYTLKADDGYTMNIETEHGYNSELGQNGTSVVVSVTSPSGKTQVVANDFVDSYNSRAQGSVSGVNYVAYNNATVVGYINRIMPYYKSLANDAKKRI